MLKRDAQLQPLMMRRDYGKAEEEKKDDQKKEANEDYDTHVCNKNCRSCSK